jgi:hypothetical protein
MAGDRGLLQRGREEGSQPGCIPVGKEHAIMISKKSYYNRKRSAASRENSKVAAG